MTKQELIQMMGDEDKANWAMERMLENVKRDFVLMCLKATADKYEAEYNAKVENGYYKEFSKFPENFNLWTAISNGDPLAEQWDKNEERQIEQCSDMRMKNFAGNMYTHALWH